MNSPAALIVGPKGSETPRGFQRVDDTLVPKIAPLPRAAKLFGMSRRQLYSILFSPIHVTPPGIVWKFRGRQMVDLEKLEVFLRGGNDAKP